MSDSIQLEFRRTVPVFMRLNGRVISTEVEPSLTLLDWLRDRVALTGTKKACREGACGACTVLIDGKCMKSCLMLVAQCADREVTMIEGSFSEIRPFSAVMNRRARMPT